MASRSVAVLKLVGTVTLGLFTGVSYSLSTLTVPTLLTLPSAGAAARAFDSLAASAWSQLRSLSAVSGSALMLAYTLSPRTYRHPYLLYTSALVLGSRLVVSDLLAPHLFPAPAASGSAPTAASRKRRTQASRARMEASYEVLASSGSDAHSEGTVDSNSGEEPEGEEGDHAAAAASSAAAAVAGDVNGEEVRAKVELFLKKQMVQTVVAGLGFVMAVVGIWGDGVSQVCEVRAVVY